MLLQREGSHERGFSSRSIGDFVYLIPYKSKRPALVRCSTGSVASTVAANIEIIFDMTNFRCILRIRHSPLVSPIC